MKKPDETHFFGQINQKALILKDGKVLAIQFPKTDKKAAGKWDLPGGRLNEGENPLMGFRREVLEEIGADIVVEKIVATGTFISLVDVPNFFVIYQATLLDKNKPFVFEEAEVADARWFDPKEFLSLPIIYPEYQEALKAVLIF